MHADDILTFWFHELEPAQWWTKDPELDHAMLHRFGPVHGAAARCELAAWRGSPEGRLAEVIVLDQFSRNLYRGLPQAFAQDALALALAQVAVAAGDDAPLSPEQRSFLYMPYMHSESPLIHQEAVRLFTANGISSNLDFEMLHKDIIDRFGRYPHRNAILGRASTSGEIAFLEGPGSSF